MDPNSAGGPFDARFIVLIGSGFFLLLLALAFASLAVWLRFRNERRGARWGALEREWTPVLMEVLAGRQSPVDLLQRITEQDQGHFLDYLLRIARRLRGEERQRACELASPLLQGVRPDLRSFRPARRARAVLLFGALGWPDYEREVVAALDDPSPFVVMVAAQILMQREHPEGGEAVLRRLHRFEAWNPSLMAAFLAESGPALAPALRSLLADPAEPPRARRVAAETLLLLNDAESPDVAARVLEGEGEPGPSLYVILDAQQARELAAGGPALEPESPPAQEPSGTDPELVIGCLKLLARLGRPAHHAAARRWVSSSDYAIRSFALSALARLGDERDHALLLDAVSDPSPWVALHAARGLRDAGGHQMLHLLSTSGSPAALVARQVLSEGQS